MKKFATFVLILLCCVGVHTTLVFAEYTVSYVGKVTDFNIGVGFGYRRFDWEQREDHTIELWDNYNKSRLLLKGAKAKEEWLFLHMPPDDSLAAARIGGEIYVWDTRTGKLLYTIPDGNGAPLFSPDNSVLATALTLSRVDGSGRWIDGSESTTFTLWDSRSGEKLDSFERNISSYVLIGFSPDNSVLVTQSTTSENSDDILLWDIRTGKLLHTLKGHESWSRYIHAFSSDNRLFTSVFRSSQDEPKLGLWDVRTGKLLHILEEWAPGAQSAPVFSPDDSLLACIVGYSIKLWDTRTGKPLRTISADGGIPHTLAFSPGRSNPFYLR